MKNLFVILSFTLVFFSCSESDDFTPNNSSAAKQPIRVIKALDPTKLSKVIFYPGTNRERTWYFYTNGLLKKIVHNDGTLIQDFFYDANMNLSSTHFYGDPNFIGNPYNFNFSYDASNHLSLANSTQYTYNSSNNTYSSEQKTFTLNSDQLFKKESYVYLDYQEPDQPPVAYTIYGVNTSYNNNNLVLHSEYDSPSSTHYLHDSKTNPFREALLPICKTLGLLFFGDQHMKWINGMYSSQNNVVKRFYEIEDPESDQFEYVYNTNNLPISQTRKSYYFNTLETTTLDIKYYYQGDEIPMN